MKVSNQIDINKTSIVGCVHYHKRSLLILLPIVPIVFNPNFGKFRTSLL